MYVVRVCVCVRECVFVLRKVIPGVPGQCVLCVCVRACVSARLCLCFVLHGFLLRLCCVEQCLCCVGHTRSARSVFIFV